MFYELPPQLDSEIADLEKHVKDTVSGSANPEELKAHRVPFGVYEQRKSNTYMMRVRCPGGAITPTQLRTIAQLAQKYGAPIVHISTRQELQLHDVLLGDIISVMQVLKAAGLSTRGGGGNSVRNIVASPSAGADPVEMFDVSPYVFALTSRFLAEPDSWLLPRKFKIGFSNSEDDIESAAFQDLGFVAKLRDGQRGFKVYIAGGLGAKPAAGKQLYEFLPAEEVYIVAEAVKRLYGRLGNRRNKHHNRLRFLWEDLGARAFVDQYQNYERDVRAEKPAFPLWTAIAAEIVGQLPVSISVTGSAFAQWKSRYVFPHKRPGLNQVLLPVVHGNLPVDQAIKLAEFIEPFGPDSLRGTREQSILLRHIPESHLGNVYSLVKDWNPFVNAASFLSRAVVCTGASTCKLGICLPRPAMDAMVDRICQTDLPLDDLKDFRMNISGCPNACGNHWAADLGFYGRASHKDGRFYPAYSVVAGGMAKKGTIALGAKIGEVAARYLPALVHDFLEGYARKKSHRCLFREYFETEGIEDLKALCLLYKKPTDYSVNPEMYTDWGTTAPFSLAERGQGECSAGLFDLIDFDLKKARESLTAMLSEKASDKRTFLLRQSVRSSARALLVTRGAEPHSDDHVFDLFIKHFVNTKLIGDRFTPLLATCCSGSMEACDTLESDAHDFLAAIVRLYQSMDDSFHFKSDKAAAVSIAAAAATADEQPKPVFKDLRGVACPMNFVKTKLVLDGMSSHQHLTILLDDGNPIMNVPRSVQGEGHKVLEQTKKGDHWVVLIEKSDG